MSTYFRPAGRIPLNKVKNNCKSFRVVYLEEQRTSAFFDGSNYLHFNTCKSGDVIDIFRYGSNDPTNILEELERVFNLVVWSEYDEEYSEVRHPETEVIQIHIPVHDFRKEPPKES